MDNEAFIIRPATNADITIVKNIIATVLTEYGLKHEDGGKDKDLNDLEKNYFANNGFFGVVENKASLQIVGTFGLYVVGEDIFELRKMYLLKQVRGKGLGKLMLNTVIDICKKKNAQTITLETIAPLKEAIAMYRKFGFTEIKPKEINARVDQAFELHLD